MQKQAVIATMVIGLIVSLLAAGLTTLVLEANSWLAYIGWLIFFASLQAPFILSAAKTGKTDPCTSWLLRLVGLNEGSK